MSYTWTAYTANGVGAGVYGKCFAGSASGQYIMSGGESGTGEASVAYTTDSGVVWNTATVVNENANVISLACSSDGSVFYAILNNSPEVHYSNDYGATWQVVDATAFSDVNLTCITCDALGQNVVVSTTVEGPTTGAGKLYFSTNPVGVSPGTWIESNVTGADWTSVAVNFDATKFIALASDNGAGTTHGTPGIYYSTDGQTWTIQVMSGGLNANRTWTSVACNNNNQSNMATVVCSSGVNGSNSGTVWYTNDSGNPASWTAIHGTVTEYVSVTIDTVGNKVAACAQAVGFFYGDVTGLPSIPSDQAPGDGSALVLASYLYPTADGPGLGLPQCLGANASGTLFLASYSVEPPTPVDPICFKEGTQILCSVDGKDTYVPVQSMRPGTLVKTYLHGYKKVEHIGFSKSYNPGNGKKSLANFAKCTPAKYPELTEDLVVTGAHSILVSTITPKQEEDLRELMGKIYITDDKYRLVACLDDRAEPYPDEGTYTIWHFALENEQYTWNYGVYANGLLVETASRRMMKEFSGMTLL